MKKNVGKALFGLAQALAYNVPLGRLFGVPVSVSAPLAALLAFLMYSSPPAGLLLLYLYFLCVLPHEFGHILAARWYGYETNSVVIHPLGGVAFFDDLFGMTAKQEFVMTVAGPLVNLVAGGVLWCFIPVSEAVWPLARIQLSIGLFNLLVLAYPADGGRILRSALKMVTSHYRATLIAVRVSWCVCFAGTLAVFIGFYYGHYNYALLPGIALMIGLAGIVEAHHAKVYLFHDYVRAVMRRASDDELAAIAAPLPTAMRASLDSFPDGMVMPRHRAAVQKVLDAKRVDDVWRAVLDYNLDCVRDYTRVARLVQRERNGRGRVERMRRIVRQLPDRSLREKILENVLKFAM